MNDWAVVVAGGGPTGLMLAAELALAGVDVAVVERRTTQTVDGSRAGGLHARTLEVLDQRGVADRFVSAGQPHPGIGYAQIMLDISDLPTRHNCVLALWQSEFEPILADWVDELGVPILRGRDVVGFTDDDSGLDVEVSDGTVLRAQYLVGCDGGRSTVRKVAAIEFAGLDASTSWIRAEVDMADEPELGFRRDSAGTHALGRRRDGDPVGVVITERSVEHGIPDIDALRAALVGVYGTDFGLRSASWITRFNDMSRQATAYRRGRVVLAGDAAHIHPPQGGQGLNTGVQDAVNLGWKLAQVVRGTSPDSLLDTYHTERHPVGARVLQNTMAQVALGLADDRSQALRDTMIELLGMDEPRHLIAAMITGLDIRYGIDDGHPLIGRRMPDLDLRTTNGATRVSTLLHDARPVLLLLGEPVEIDITSWADRVDLVHGECDGPWRLPVLGEVQAPSAVLIRPDGHVAWAGEPTDSELRQSLTTWFGHPTQTP